MVGSNVNSDFVARSLIHIKLRLKQCIMQNISQNQIMMCKYKHVEPKILSSKKIFDFVLFSLHEHNLK